MARSWYAWFKLDTRVLYGRQSNPYGFLRDDLYLSDETDDEPEIDPVGLSPNIAAERSVSPVDAPQAIHDSRSAVNLNGGSLPKVKNLFYAPEPIIQPPPPNLSRESGSESDTTNDDSVEEYLTSVRVPKMLSPLDATPPPIHNSRSDLHLNRGTYPQVRKHVYAPIPIIKFLLTSSSESDSESNSDNDDSTEKNVTPAGLSRPQPATKQSAPQNMLLNMKKSAARDSKRDPSPRNPTLFSPTPLKKDEPAIKLVKTEPVSPVKNMKPDERKKMPSWVEIDLDYLKTIPTLRERFEQKMPWLFQSNVTESVNGKEEKQAPIEDSTSEVNEKENKNKTVTKLQDASREHSDREHESLKRKRIRSISSHSTISNMSGQSKVTEHNLQHIENKDKDDCRKLKRRKEEDNQPHEAIHIGDQRDIAEVPCIQTRSQTENISPTGAPPSNNERVPMIEEQQRDTIRSPEPVPPVGKTNVPPKSVRREYHSKIEHPEELMEHEIRDKNLIEAVRLKKRAERNPDPIKQCMLYLEAVQYFLLTNLAMESAFVTERAAFNMYKDTLTQIQYIATTFRKPQNTAPVFQKLAVLSYRCEAVLFYKLFAMSMNDARKIQKRMGEYCDKHLQNPVSVGGTAPLAEHHPHSQRQSTPPHLSPSPSPDSVVSVISQSSGYNSGGPQPAPGGTGVFAEAMDAALWVPLPICNAITKIHHHLGYLMSCQELWDMADNMVIKGNYTKFFNELDRSCKPLSMHSSIVDLVRYVREGIRRLRYRNPFSKEDAIFFI